MISLPSSRSLIPAPARLQRIVLTGFMGSGKTSVGTLLAAQLGWRFADLDREIEQREGRSVPLIFSQSGEPHFRQLESLVLASLLAEQRLVLALGGGTPEHSGNRLLLTHSAHTAIVYLSADYATLLHRCRLQSTAPAAVARPVLNDPAIAEQRFHLRRPLYEHIATHTVDTTALTPEAALAVILNALHTTA